MPLFLIRFWPYLAGAALVVAALVWHSSAVDAAYKDGAEGQARVDLQAFLEAQKLAEEAQETLIAKVKSRNTAINKETTDALAQRNADLTRTYTALRLRWAKAKADPSSARSGEAVAVAGAPAGTLDAACSAQGWVDFGTAAAIAEAADVATAKDDAWITWYNAQREQWPQTD